MKRVLAATTIGLGLLAPVATATHQGLAGGERDFAVGAGSSEFALGAVGEARFSLSATGEPAGTHPQGYVTSKGDPDGAGPMKPFTAAGEITCLRVEGNRASIKWRLERATGSAEPFEGGGVQSFLEDNGEPRRGEPLDRALIDPPQPAATFAVNASTCDEPNSRATYDRLEQGDVTVHDAMDQ